METGKNELSGFVRLYVVREELPTCRGKAFHDGVVVFNFLEYNFDADGHMFEEVFV